MSKNKLVGSVLGVLAGALLLVALPASAHANPVKIVNRQVLNDIRQYWCLDSNRAGFVYINPCANGRENPHQLWDRWEGGWTRNVATGMCLTNKPLGEGAFDARTVGCVNHPSQFWRSWNGGWYLSPASWFSPDSCLGRTFGDVHDTTMYGCFNPNQLDPPLNWYVLPA